MVRCLSVQALSDHHVLLEGTLLKPNMVRCAAGRLPYLGRLV
jgi:Fructose-bisphosphate aldolase class-I